MEETTVTCDKCHARIDYSKWIRVEVKMMAPVLSTSQFHFSRDACSFRCAASLLADVDQDISRRIDVPSTATGAFTSVGGIK
jgi:hypothetical protein